MLLTMSPFTFFTHPPAPSPLASIPWVSRQLFRQIVFCLPLCGDIWKLYADIQDWHGHRPIFLCGRVVTIFIVFWGLWGLRMRRLWDRAWQRILGLGGCYASGLSHLYYAGPGPLTWTLLSWDAGEMCGEQSGRHREGQKECQAVSEPQKCQQSAECRRLEAWNGMCLGSGKRSRQHAFVLPCLVSFYIQLIVAHRGGSFPEGGRSSGCLDISWKLKTWT